MKWRSKRITKELEKIISYDENISLEIEDKLDPSEYYCSEIYLTIEDLDNDNNIITICGFIDSGDDISDSYNPDEDITHVEVRDCNGNGISKNANKRLKKLYNEVVGYFNKYDVEIVDDLHDYF